MRRSLVPSLLVPSLLVLVSCALASASDVAAGRDKADEPVDSRPVHPAAPAPEAPEIESSPPPSPRLIAEIPDQLADRIDTWFAGHGTRRVHIQLDRPLYRPGETIWLKTWNVATRTLEGQGAAEGITYELVDPRGQVVETKRVQQIRGSATNDFVLPEGAPGGRWTLRARSDGGELDERPIVVASYQTPRIRKELDFLREAYGPGDRVEALVELKGPTGAPLADHPVRALLQVDGATVVERLLRTDPTGAVFVGADLPRQLASGDGLLTVLVEDGGVTESISRSVPILLDDLELAFFPEGGDLVSGLPARVYLEGTDSHGEPADVEGYVEDDRGRRVASFRSVHDGMGRFAFTPEPGRTYRAKVTAPEGIAGTWTLPAARSEGCTLRSFDDLRSELDHLRVGVRCTARRDVVVTGVLGERTIDAAAVRAGPHGDAVVHLAFPEELAARQGAVRVTVFDDEVPLAERLVYRNHGRDLRIELTPDREVYGPRDEVVLTVRTTDPEGAPQPAEIALSVVDDAVIGLADSEEGHMLTRLFLEPELVDSPDDPAWYYDPEEALAARGIDLVLGTRGWRHFEWRPVLEPPQVVAVESRRSRWPGRGIPQRMSRDDQPLPAPPMPAAPMGGAPVPPPPMDLPMAEPAPAFAGPALAGDALLAGSVADAADAPAQEPMDRLEKKVVVPRVRLQRAQGKRAAEARELDAAGGELLGAVGYLDQLGYLEDIGYLVEQQNIGWAPVRVFPRPEPRPFTGVRSDFRDTVLWEPGVVTDADGRATVRFHLSDAVTAFRITAEGLGITAEGLGITAEGLGGTAEGLGGGFAGHEEAVVRSVLPVSVDTKLPPAVSAGDRLLIPLTVGNTRPASATLQARASADSHMLAVGEGCGALRVGGGSSETCWVPVEVGSGNEVATVRVEARGEGISDAVERELVVVPPGFPRSWSAAGEHRGEVRHTFVLEEIVPESLRATVTWHASPVADLISGMEGLIATPGGCFEQTSSTNWPNVAILSYLEAHDGDPRLRANSARALQVGYDKLSGYQVSAGGFETWGSGPGKEALSAFGLLQFTDMSRVYPVDEAVLARDVDYLLSQRDGKGGFRNSGESAHGYGSAPAAVLDGFITWALVSTGHGDQLERELARQAEVARTSRDPYVLALAARSLIATGDPAADAAVRRLAALQAKDGSFPGAESSITRSYEANLDVESTALAAMALMEAGGRRPEADLAAKWLVENRRGVGTWGATQATALALGALTMHAEVSRAPRIGGRLSVEVNGERVGSLRYEPDQATPLEIDGLEEALVVGENEIVLRHDGGEPLPYTIDVGWTSVSPASEPGAELGLVTRLDRASAKMGESVRLTARIDNRTEAVVPSPIARIGLPAGLEAQTWQLEELQDRGVIAFFETRPREVTLYWDGLHADQAHEVKLDLVAAVPGTFTGPASSAYPYYDDDEKAWSGGLAVEIRP